MEESLPGSGATGPEEPRERTQDAPGAHRSPPALLESLVTRVPDPAVVVDEDGGVVAANERLAELLDRPLDGLEEATLAALFADLRAADVARHCRAADAGEYLTCRTAGPDRWVDLAVERHHWDGDGYYLAVVHDVTDRYERTQELAQYERIVETIDDGVYTLDESFTIETVNSAVERMTGYDESDLVGSTAQVLASESALDRAARLTRQLRAGERDVATLTTALTTADGGRLPIETRFTTYERPDGTHQHIGVVRDISDRRRFERTLAALQDATRELINTESVEAVCRVLVRTATSVLGLPGAALYRFDTEQNALVRANVSVPEGAASTREEAAVGPGDGAVWDVFVADERERVAADAVPGCPELAALSGAVELIPLDDHGVFVVGTEDGERRTRELVDLLAATGRSVLARVDREATLRERESERREQNRRLRRLKQVNAVIRRIDRALVEAETREEVEQAVSEELADSDLFAFAWVGRRDETAVVPRAWAGTGAGYLDDVDLATTGEDGPPAVQTARSASMTVVPTVADGLRRAPWRAEALSHDFQSAISVPLAYEEFVYGVLTVYAGDQDAFGEMLQSVFTDLGATIANALRAVDSRRHRSGGEAVELRLSVSAPDDPITRVAERLDAPVTCEGAVPNGEHTTRHFLRVPDRVPEAVHDVTADLTRVESTTTVTTEDGTGLYEVVVTGPTVPRTLVDLGARVGTSRATADGVETTVALAADTEVREFVERMQRRYPDTRLAARRQRETAIETAGDVRGALGERLTDRQLEVLRTAYLSGYFEWPRATSGAEVADLLDVSQPTVNRHLRVSQRELLDLVLGDG